MKIETVGDVGGGGGIQMKALAISEFCKTGSGGTPSRSKRAEYYDGGTIPWIKSGELAQSIIKFAEEFITEQGLSQSSAKLLQPGAILIAMYGATVGQVSRLAIPASTNQAICHIYPDLTICEPDYLYRVLKGAKEKLLAKRVGGGQPNINQKIVRSLQIPLPPLTEQKRIAKILDAADALRAKRRKAIAQLDTFLQSTFIDMFGDPVTNPMGWEVKPLGELGTLNRGISKHRPRNEPTLLGGSHPLIQTGEVANSNGYIRSYTSTYSDLGLKQSKMWPTGTLCITIAANIASTGILTFDACFPDSVVGFLSNETGRVEYVQGLFWFFKDILDRKAPQVAQKNINLKILRGLPVPLPSNDLQTKFATIVKSVEQQKARMQAHLTELDTLFAALQQQAFNGEL